MLKVLTFSSLFPNAAQPNHGVFVENRLRRVHETGRVRVTVLAPVPYFPFRSSLFARYGAFAEAPDFESRHGMDVYHPRYLMIPKISQNVHDILMYRGVRRLVAELHRTAGPFDLIDAHYFYPDGVVAARIARDLEIPFVITGRGSDLSELPDYPVPRRKIIHAAQSADHLITVCQALKDRLIELGLNDSSISVFRNGVDLDTFRPQDREQAKRKLGIESPLFVSVGHLIERKGHHLVISALARVPHASLLIAGTGPEENALRRLTGELGLEGRVHFAGQRPHSELPSLYSAADALVLASSREGWANVLLEAMACGTPAIATDVWGTREVVGPEESGLLVRERTAPALAEAMNRILENPPSIQDTRQYAERFSWSETTENQIRLFNEIVSKQNS